MVNCIPCMPESFVRYALTGSLFSLARGGAHESQC